MMTFLRKEEESFFYYYNNKYYYYCIYLHFFCVLLCERISHHHLSVFNGWKVVNRSQKIENCCVLAQKNEANENCYWTLVRPWLWLGMYHSLLHVRMFADHRLGKLKISPCMVNLAFEYSQYHTKKKNVEEPFKTQLFQIKYEHDQKLNQNSRFGCDTTHFQANYLFFSSFHLKSELI